MRKASGLPEFGPTRATNLAARAKKCRLELQCRPALQKTEYRSVDSRYKCKRAELAAVIAPADADVAVRLLAERGVPAWVIGEISPGTGNARLVGSHYG